MQSFKLYPVLSVDEVGNTMTEDNERPLTRLQKAVDNRDEYDAVWVSDVDKRYGLIRVEWDDRADSAAQITKLQQKVNSTAPLFPEMEVHHADVTTREVTFVEEERI